MRLISLFFRDRFVFTIIYSVCVTYILVYFALSTDNAKIFYPICVSLFFYLIYMIVEFILYYSNWNKINRIKTSNFSSVNNEYNHTFKAISSLKSEHNNELIAEKSKSENKKRFISAAIHNLKTPVTVSSIILQRLESGEIELAVAKPQLAEEFRKLSAGLDMLLELDRLDEMTNDYEPKKINLQEELGLIINTNKSLFINNHIYPKLEVDNAFVYTDEKWNRVLITQIITNAVKYSAGDGEKHIYFSARTIDNYTELSITDEGIGIPDYDLPRVFEAYFTGENGRKEYNSSGIGLYLCKSICNSLNHKIRIENVTGADKKILGCKVTISYLSKL